jgi:disulfide bond formation protein DsbB
MHDLFAVLASIAIVGSLLMAVARVAPSVVAVRSLALVHRVQLPLAAAVAVVASLGSFWMSEFGNHLPPCRFCWFQRIFMYALGVVLLVAAVRRDRGVKVLAVVLAVCGSLFSIWHNLLERGVVQESSACAATVPCGRVYLVSFGHMSDLAQPAGFPSFTLASMALCGFLSIIALMLLPEPLDADEVL